MGAIITQYVISTLLSVLTLMLAFANVWPSYALKMLESHDSPLGYSITTSDGNLIGSISMLGSLAAVTIVGYLNEKIGRKRTEILSGLCFTLAWSIIATSKGVTQLVIGRFVLGFGAAIHIVTCLVFMGEITQTSMKGAAMAVLTFMYNIGSLLSYVVGWFCTYQVINYLSLVMAVVSVIIILFMKETPPYLLRNGKEKEALNSLKFYRGASSVTQDILDELVYLRSQLESTNNNDIDDRNTKLEMEKLNPEKSDATNQTTTEQSSWKIFLFSVVGFVVDVDKMPDSVAERVTGFVILAMTASISCIPSILKLICFPDSGRNLLPDCTSKASQRAIIILSTHMIMSVFMGMIGVQTYAGQFFRRAVPDISADLCSVILAIVFVLTSAVAIVVTDIVPRRVLMISTCLLSGASLILLSSMLRWSWAPVLCIPLTIVLFSIFYQVGAIVVPFAQISECLSPQMKSFGTTVVMLSMYLANFVVLYLFEPALSVLGLDGLFFMFSIISILTAIVAYFLMRETRNVPFETVKDMFEYGYLYRKP